MKVITSAFLLARSALGLLFFLAAAGFFVALAFLVGLCLAFGFSASGVGVLFSIESLIIDFFMTGLRS